MHLKDVGHIFALHVPEDIDEPLEVAVRRTDPQEVDLFARDTRIPIRRGAEHQVVQDGGVRGHPDAAAHHDGHLELVPVLIATSEGTLDPHLGRVVLVFFLLVDGLVEAASKRKALKLAARRGRRVDHHQLAKLM